MIKDIEESKYELYQYGTNRHIIIIIIMILCHKDFKTTKHAKAGVKIQFHRVDKNFGAVAENDPSYRAVFDLGTDKEPHVTDRKLQLWVSDTGFNTSVMNSEVKLFIAL